MYKRQVCYFTNWSYDRQGKGSFVPENMDASLCSHVVYAFATLDSVSLEMAVGSETEDIKTGEIIVTHIFLQNTITHLQFT